MVPYRRPTSYRDFADVLRSLGATIVRTKATHEQWRLPTGRMFTLSVSRGAWTNRRAVLDRWSELRRLVPELTAIEQ